MYATLRTRLLLALLPGSTTLPSLVPFSVVSRVVSFRPALGFSLPWHFTQETSKIGLMSASKVTFALVAAGGSLVSSAAALKLNAREAMAATVRVLEIRCLLI